MSDSPETHADDPPHFGDLPPWGKDKLPAPAPFTVRNALRVIGPGAILLAGSIGGGEWLIGPAMSVEHGTSIMWIATVAIVLQLALNLEAIRYTLYTGEPILVGAMRLRPGSKFWAWFYILLTVAQLGVPALAAGCASVLFATFAGRVAGNADASALTYITYGVIALGVAILCSGKTIERMLQFVSWAMVAFILVFLLVVNVLFVPWAHWGTTLAGFFQFGSMPPNVDILLLGAFAATAGSGGVGNLTISNYFRDKGFGMGATVGAIGGAFSGESHVSAAGNVFAITTANLANWREWWKYVYVDQVCLWAGGCFAGMFLNVNLATSVIPKGTDLQGIGAGAFQAQYMAEQLWSGFWVLALVNGFWILFSTHLGNTDILVRTVTDILWVASPRLRQFERASISRLYYSLLAIFTVWGLIAVNWGHAMALFKVLGVIAGLVLAIAAAQILRINTKLLPAELRPSLLRRAGLVLCALFYGALSAAQVWNFFR